LGTRSKLIWRGLSL